MLWIPITLVAATAQVLRNGAQASLTGTIGTLGSTQIRFVFALPFATLLLAASLVLADGRLQPLPAVSLSWTCLGAVSQIAATALMLIVMHRRAFGVAYAYIKTEPIVVAILGMVILGDNLPALGWIAVVTMTSGVLLASVKPSDLAQLFGEARMIVTGIVAGGLFGLSAIAFRGAIDGIPQGSFVVRSLQILVLALAMQSALLGFWLWFRDRGALTGSVREWRKSTGAGLLGALASACWFCAFALTPAANVRALGLIEMPIAALLSGKLTGRSMKKHELAGLMVVALGLILLLAPAWNNGA